MSQKVFYRYNQTTERFERVYPSKRERLYVFVRQFIVGVIVALLLCILAYNVIDTPREKELRKTNERLASQVDVLNRRIDEATTVMEDLAARDNNFYRVMLQAEPMTAARRYAGLERQRAYDALDSMPDAELLRNVNNKLDMLERLIYSQIKSYDYLRDQAAMLDQRVAHIPAIQPVSEKYLRVMASGYGYRVDPVYGTKKFHEGMDFSAPQGTPVYATGDGTVIHSSWESAYGNLIEINHGYNYVTRYAHLSEILVHNGQSVKRGDLIGKVGNTGKSTGPHLHYEVRLRGEPQNPVNYYFFDLTPAQYDEMIRLAENAGHVMD
jgi:murein DD-endopeptidase MepM/ murein hydrolase activator NlpD